MDPVTEKIASVITRIDMIKQISNEEIVKKVCEVIIKDLKKEFSIQ